jgi:hypothetical protein
MEITPRFKSSYSGVDMSGESALDIFMDRVNPMNKQAHPALPNVIKELDVIRKQRGSGSATQKGVTYGLIYRKLC